MSLIKPANRGLLHSKLGVPQGQKIPAAKIAAAKQSASPALRKEATFAQNFSAKPSAPKRPSGQFGGKREIDGKVNGPGMAEPSHPQNHAAFEKL